MYRVNCLHRNVLITPDEVIRHMPGTHTMDRLKIENSIIIAEERFIRPALTNNLYKLLILEKNTLVTDVNRLQLQTLINLDFDNTENIISEGQIINAYEFLGSSSKLLWNEILWKLTAECVALIAMPQAYIQFTNTGIVLSNPPASPMGNGGVVSPDLRSMKWAMDNVMTSRIDPLLQALHTFLCENKKTLYPLYSKLCECDEKTSSKKTQFIIDVYDIEPKICCKGWDQFNNE